MTAAHACHRASDNPSRFSPGCRHLGLAAASLALVTLGGCASVDPAERAHAHLPEPVKLLLIQSPMAVSAKRMQSVFAPKSKHALALSSPMLTPAVAHAQDQARADMHTALAGHTGIVITRPPAQARPLIAQIEKQPYTSALSPAQAGQLQSDTGADAILRYGITDYGLTPTSWRTSYITFEVVSTLAITAVIASVGTTVAKGAAGAYLAQETVEETAESYAGFWALDVTCRPVRIVAKLIQPRPLGVVWQDDDTGLSDIKLSRLYRTVSEHERDQQLDQSTEYAVSDLVTALTDRLSGKKEIHTPATLKWER